VSEDHLDVHLLVLIDNIGDATQVRESLGTIDGATTVDYLHGTNVTYVAANWKESELDNKIKDVQSTPDVKTVKITKKSRAVARALPPRMY
jgi:hypothetical protein